MSHDIFKPSNLIGCLENKIADSAQTRKRAIVTRPFPSPGGRGLGTRLHQSQLYISQVKDQGKCKSSWAFSAMGALEGQNFKKSGHLLDLSIQQAIDCSWRNGNRGCHGGLAMNVFDYVNQAHGVCASSSYTYIGYVSNTVLVLNLY